MSRTERKKVKMSSWWLSRNDEEFGPDIMLVAGWGNTGVVITAEGVVVVDNGLVPDAKGNAQIPSQRSVEAIKAKTQTPINTIIYTHGHLDHAFATEPLL
jgi:glyoxylase-like metal-dependent hydrolase (beta-lactamase superfamily II)